MSIIYSRTPRSMSVRVNTRTDPTVQIHDPLREHVPITNSMLSVDPHHDHVPGEHVHDSSSTSVLYVSPTQTVRTISGVSCADYIMYSMFLTSSSGSVLFNRSNLLKRKDLSFSFLRLGLIRHRRSPRSSLLFSSVCNVFRVIHSRTDILISV
jgi:hypothetical protein